MNPRMNLIETPWTANSLEFSSDKRERFPGLHVSKISKSLCESRGINSNPRNMTPEQVDEYAAIGFLEEGFSQLLMQSLADAPCIIQPPVVAYNGVDGMFVEKGMTVPPGWVIGTPDWLYIDDTGIVLEDAKATYLSYGGAATPMTWLLKKRWHWELNTKFYLLALRACGIEIERIRFRILWMAGDYRPVRPVRRLWTSDPISDEELQDNWMLLAQHAQENAWL